MPALIVCASVSHGNTQRIADELGRVLPARVVEPEQVEPGELASYDLVGFGSGIFTGSYHPRLRALVASIPDRDRGRAFVFATSGFPDSGPTRYSPRLVRRLEQKGFEVLDTFSCRGWDTWLPFRPVGGLRKGRPSGTDLAAARAFAERMGERVAAGS